MIYKRFAARLKAQDWLAITIELVIVVVGVFIGTLVANWNAERLERAETRRMIVQLGPTLRNLNDYFPLARKYYRVTRAYADTAIAGWNGDPRVSDSDFVQGAYQASQIFILGINGSAFSRLLGEDRLRQIDDPRLRDDLTSLITNDFSQIDTAAVDTPYRRNIRRLIPIDVQEEIRDKCGDRVVPGRSTLIYLPSPCTIPLAPARAAKIARALRSRPDLSEDLQGHLSAVRVMMDNAAPVELWSRSVTERSKALLR